MYRIEGRAGTTRALDGVRRADQGVAKEIANLERVIARSADEPLSAWATAAIAALFKVRASLDGHIAITEEPGGLFEEILDHAPRLTHEVQAIRNDRKNVESRIADTLVALTDPSEERRSLAARLTDLHRVIEAHRKREADLVYEAYQVDIGPED